jgi:ribonuclease R
VVDLYRAFFLRDRIGDVLEGTISSVMGFGLFVVIDQPFVEGLVRLEALSDDYYVFDETASKLVGRRSGRTFALGDMVKVEVQSVSVVRRKIDFALHEHRARHADGAGRGDGHRRDRARGKDKHERRGARADGGSPRTARRRDHDGVARVEKDHGKRAKGKTHDKLEAAKGGLRTSAKRADRPKIPVHGSKPRSSAGRGKRRK